MSGPQASWTILAILRWTTDYFRTKGVSEPRASAEVLLAHTLGVSRLDLYLRYDQPLNPEELARFKALMVRRREGEPVAYLTGHREFWSLDIQVTPAVLIPRPETETLVAAALEAAEICEGKGGGDSPTLHSWDEAGSLNEQKEPRNRKPQTSLSFGPGGGRRQRRGGHRPGQGVALDGLGGPGSLPARPWPWPGPMSSGMGCSTGSTCSSPTCWRRSSPRRLLPYWWPICLMCPGRSGNGSPGDQGI